MLVAVLGSAICLGAHAPPTQADEQPKANSRALGRELFLRQWKANDERTPSGDGLGPMFNARSCVACHDQGGTGGGGAKEHNVELFCLIPPESKSRIVPAKFVEKVGLIHPGMVTAAQGVLPSVTLHRFGGHPTYGNWRVSLTMLADLLPPVEDTDRISVRIHERNTPALFGAGLIDSISDSVLEQTARKQSRLATGVRGRVARAGSGGAGKFGWRGQTATLKQFVMGACANELGLQVPENSQPVDPLNPKASPRGLDLDQDQCDALVDFVASLRPPKPRQSANRREQQIWTSGAQLFTRVGCADCHMQRLGTVDGIYSDLLLHDLGEHLADTAGANPPTSLQAPPTSTGGYYGGTASLFVEVPPETLRQWRTPPLWGVSASAPYMHDGRAATLEAAIREHGGEATHALKNYDALKDDARKALMAFLESLGPKP